MKKIYFFILIISSINSQSQVLLSQSFDTAIGWTYNSVVNGQTGATEAGWIRQTIGTNPNCSPYVGNGMACFMSHNVLGNTIAGLYSPSITFSGLNYRVRFKMFRITTNTILSNEINVYINSTNSLTGATLLGTFKPFINESPSVNESGWYDCYANLPAGTTGSKYIIFRGKANVGFGDNVYIDEVSIEQTPLVDASLDTFNMSSNILSGSKTISGKFSNRGTTTINSININWQENNGTINTQTLTGLNITTGQTYNYSHSVNWNAVPQQTTMRVWLTNINGGVQDGYLPNNEIIKPINVFYEYFPHNIVYEEITGTWCGYCPKGIVALKDMHHYNTDGSFIGIAVHKGQGSDPMNFPEYVTGLTGLSDAVPTGVFNRNNQLIVYPNYSAVNLSYIDEKAKKPVAKINLSNTTWNSATRQITVDAQVLFAMNLSNLNYRVAVVVLEDNVSGTSSSYNQFNYYSGNTDVTDWEGINWRNLPSQVSFNTMRYDYVARALLGGFNGVSGVIPNNVVFNTSYNHTFTHTLPTTQNVNKISLVALLLDNATGQIVNASKLVSGTLALSEFNNNSSKIYPNPSSGIVTIESINENNTLEVYDVMGNKVFSSNLEPTSTIDISFLQKGIYILKISNEYSSESHKLILK